MRTPTSPARAWSSGRAASTSSRRWSSRSAPSTTTQHYAQAARTLAACPDIDAIYIKDPGGLLSPRRAGTLIPAVKAQIGAKPLELHSHCTIGLGELLYLEAAELRHQRRAVRRGRDRRRHLQSAGPARGAEPARPRAPVPVDTGSARRGRAATSPRSPRPRACPSVRRSPSTPRYLRHQLPGGMIGTMRRQLAEHRLSAPRGGGHRGDRPGARGTRLADRHDAVRTDPADAGVPQRDRR